MLQVSNFIKKAWIVLVWDINCDQINYDITNTHYYLHYYIIAMVLFVNFKYIVFKITIQKNSCSPGIISNSTYVAIWPNLFELISLSVRCVSCKQTMDACVSFI